MQYKLRKNWIRCSFNPINEYLRSYGIEKTSSFSILGPSKDDEADCFTLINIVPTINKLKEMFDNNKKFFIQVDCDVDGYTSASIFYNYFKQRYPDAYIKYRVHENKEHGVIINTIPVECEVIILPDSGSMQLNEQEELCNQGRTVIILDHHEISAMISHLNLFIVNNQLGEFVNKSLSGAGVVFKTIQAFDKTFYPDNQIYRDYMDLAALGIVADMMDIRTLDNNYIITNGLKQIKNKMFRALLEQQAFSIKNIDNPTKIGIAFYIAPLINGVIREGEYEEKLELFEGFLNEERENRTNSRGKEETFWEFCARTSTNIKDRQKRKVDKALAAIIENLEKTKMHEHKIIIAILDGEKEEIIPQPLTGLLAMALVNHYSKPSLVVRPKKVGDIECYSGSGRGKSVEGFESLMNFLRESNMFQYIEGHDNAHGVSFERKYLNSILAYADQNLANIDFGDNTYEVEDVITSFSDDLVINYLSSFANHADIYGQGLPAPKIAFEFKAMGREFELIGANKTTIKIKKGKITFIRFKDKDLAMTVGANRQQTYLIQAIAEPSINEFMGKKDLQCTITDYSIEQIETLGFGKGKF